MNPIRCRAVAGGLLAGALAWGGTSAAPAAPAAALQPVTLSAAQRDALGVRAAALVAAARAVRAYPATVVLPASQAQVVASPATGLVERILVEPNQAVSAGQPVATLISSALPEAAAQFIQARSEAELANQTRERERALFAEGVIAQARVRQAEAAAVQAGARLQGARAHLRLLGMTDAELSRIGAADGLPGTVSLRSPAAGVVTELAVAVGQRVEAGTLVARIARPDRLALEIRVPAADLALLRAGARVLDEDGDPLARLGAPQAAIVAGQSAALRVPLYAAPGASSGAPRAAAPAGRFILGQSLQVRIETGESGWRVPRDALVRVGPDSYVFVQQGDQFVPQRVALRGTDGDAAVVEAPFGPATRVATGNVAEIKAASQGIVSTGEQ